MVRDKRTGKTKGYGFVSFANPSDLAAAMKEMNGTHSFSYSIVALKCLISNIPRLYDYTVTIVYCIYCYSCSMSVFMILSNDIISFCG